MEYLDRYFNEVDSITAVCRMTDCMNYDYSDLLQIGKTYKVSHIGVLRSSTKIKLCDMPDKEFNSVCFDFFDHGCLCCLQRDVRFIAPYLKHHYIDDPQFQKGTIGPHLSDIERKYDVKVLFAVESGSRAWGFESPTSDWDVRFIYVHKPEWYITLDAGRDVIEEVNADNTDIVGWDLKKTLFQLRRSNPLLLEWFYSPIKYRVEDYEFFKSILALANVYFNPIKAMYHYNHIYTKHDERFLGMKGFPMKRFLYYLRGILACRWIERHKTMPPVKFSSLVEATVLEQHIKDLISDLIKCKKSGKEYDITDVSINLVDYAKSAASYYDNIIGQFRPLTEPIQKTEELDSLLFCTVMEYKDYKPKASNHF